MPQAPLIDPTASGRLDCVSAEATTWIGLPYGRAYSFHKRVVGLTT